MSDQSTGQIVGGVIGAAVGAFVTRTPQGALYGYAISAEISGILDLVPENQEQGRVFNHASEGNVPN